MFRWFLVEVYTLTRLWFDDRVSKRASIVAGLAVVYVVLPVDVVTDLVPLVGWVDDVLVFVLGRIVVIEKVGVPTSVVAEHRDVAQSRMTLLTVVGGGVLVLFVVLFVLGVIVANL